jgi:hypothetical protein
MPREVVGIPITCEPLYVAVAVFLAVLAYPDNGDKRASFGLALQREHLRLRADEDEAFAAQPQPIRPALFLISDSDVRKTMRKGARELAERKEAVVATHQFFDAKETGRAIEIIRAFGEEMENDPIGRAVMTRRWKDGSWNKSQDLDGGLIAKNLTTRTLNPSRPVLHVAMAYWRIVRWVRQQASPRPSEVEVEKTILHDRDVLRIVLNLAEEYRQLAPSIPELQVREDDLIEFRTV